MGTRARPLIGAVLPGATRVCGAVLFASLSLAFTARAAEPPGPAALAQPPASESPTSPAPPASSPAPTSPAPPAEERCSAVDKRGDTFATCFDPGTRLYLQGSNEGFGGAVLIRHLVPTIDTTISWRMEHGFLRGDGGFSRFRGGAYEGRFLRHSREGSIVLPTSPPRQLSVPFDLGTEVTVASFAGRSDTPTVDLNALRLAILAELTRSDTFRHRLTIGPVSRWDMLLDRDQKKIEQQRITPFSAGAIALYLESQNGLTTLALDAEAGYSRSSTSAWQRYARAQAVFERVFLAVNDAPLSVFLAGRYDSTGRGLTAEAGLRFALFPGSRL